MLEPRNGAAVATLDNGEVLIAGGENSKGTLSSAELFNPATDAFKKVAHSMAAERKFAVAATLPDGEVLIAGGEGSPESERTVELYKPSEETFSLVPNAFLTEDGRVGARAVTLESGTVLLFGGEGTVLAINEEKFSLPTSELLTPLSSGLEIKAGPEFQEAGGIAPIVATLANGDVLIAGGFSYNKLVVNGVVTTFYGNMLSGGALYNPKENKVVSQSLHVAEERYAPATLDFEGGRGVYAVGGIFRHDELHGATPTEEVGPFRLTAEAYNPQTGSFTLSEWQPAIPREDGSVAVVGEDAFVFGGRANAALSTSGTNLEAIAYVEEIENPAPRVTFTGGTFGEVAVGQTVTQNFSVYDVGFEPLTGVAVSISGPYASDYKVVSDECAPGPVRAGASCGITLSFTPTSSQTATAELKLTDSLGQTFSLPLSGSGGLLPVRPGPTGPAASPAHLLATQMLEPRNGAAVAALDNGEVLIAGGENSRGVLKSAELFNPLTDSFKKVSSPMGAARRFAVAATLPSGEVLIAGGEGSYESENSIELYKPSEEKFTPVSGAKLKQPRSAARAVTLPNGDVLVVGGEYTPLPSEERERAFSTMSSELLVPTGSGVMVTPGPTFEGTGAIAPIVAPLADGDVLVAGGFLFEYIFEVEGGILEAFAGRMLSAGVLYSPAANKVLPQPLHVLERRYAPATLDFDDGRFVYVAGGINREYKPVNNKEVKEVGPFIPTAEAFNAQTDSFTVSEWEPVIPREDAGVAVVGEKAFVFGGEGNPYLNLQATHLAALADVEEIENPAPKVTFAGGAFGEVAVGHTTTQNVVVSNLGYEPLTGVETAIEGPSAADFKVASDSCLTTTLRARSSCVISLSFTPTSTGGATAELRLSDSLGQSFTLPLSGTGALFLGSAGPTGPTGPAGAPGSPGKVELLTCRSKTKRVRHHHLRKVHLELCKGRLLSGPIKLKGEVVKASLRRGRRTARRGFLISRHSHSLKLLFPAGRPLAPGRYGLLIAVRGGFKAVAVVRRGR